MTPLPHVRWIGGGSGAGKSVVARRLVAAHGLRLYATDDVMADHARRATPEDAPHLAAPHHAVWLLPTPTFRRAALESRGDLWSVASRTSDPERALAALLERDRLFTERLRAECGALSLRTIDVEPTTTETALATHVAESLAL